MNFLKKLSFLCALIVIGSNTTALVPQIAQKMEINEPRDYYDFFTGLETNEDYRLSAQRVVVEFDCVDKKVATLPASIKHLKNLKKLRLQQNKIREIPSEIGELTNLLSLGLSHNNISSLPYSLNSLKQLNQLYLNNNNFAELPPCVTTLVNLRKLTINKNYLKTLPREIGNLIHLKELFAASNSLSSLPSELCSLTKLTEISFSNNLLRSIPKELAYLSGLQILDFAGNPELVVPTDLQKWVGKNPTAANMSPPTPHSPQLQITQPQVQAPVATYGWANPNNNQPTQGGSCFWVDAWGVRHQHPSPPAMSAAPVNVLPVQPQLQQQLCDSQLHLNVFNRVMNKCKFYINSNRDELQALIDLINNPQTSGNIIQNLKFLSCQNLGMTKIPKELFKLRNLRSLSFTNNMISEVPPTIENLQKLENLHLNENRLKALPDEICTLQRLSGLDIRKNQLTELPTNIGNLKKLTLLTCHTNKIGILPDSIGGLCSLQRLAMGSNHVIKIPPSIGQLKQLQHLCLSSNRIETLPEEIGDCDSLETLDISETKTLTELPYNALKRMRSLHCLNASACPILNLQNLPKDLPGLFSQHKEFPPLRQGPLQQPLSLRQFSHPSPVIQVDFSAIQAALPKAEYKTSPQASPQQQYMPIPPPPQAITNPSPTLSQQVEQGLLSCINDEYKLEINGRISGHTQLWNVFIGLMRNDPQAKGLIIENLRSLSCTFLMLSEIPSEIFELKNLQHLDFSNNLLAELPTNICKLENLVRLDIQNNQLLTAPETIATLPRLEIFNFETNWMKNHEGFVIMLKRFSHSIKFINGQSVHVNPDPTSPIGGRNETPSPPCQQAFNPFQFSFPSPSDW